jgi:hypothetical protein
MARLRINQGLNLTLDASNTDFIVKSLSGPNNSNLLINARNYGVEIRIDEDSFGSDTFRVTKGTSGSITILTLENNGSLNIGGLMNIGGFDLRLGTADQSTRGNTGQSRALVKAPNAALAINYAGDFTGGVIVEGPGLGVGSRNYVHNTNTSFQIPGADNSARWFIIKDTNSGTGVISFNNTKNSDGNILGSLVWTRESGQSDGHRQVAGIVAVQTGTGSTAGADLRFYAKGTSGPIQAMTINVNGASSPRVGIGVTSPTATLDIGGDVKVSGTITGTLSGNASTATRLQTARTISLSGSLSGSTSFDGSANVSINASINDGAITTAKLADGAITTAKVADSAITTAKLADNAVTTAKVADSAITTAKLADGAITTAKVADSAITTAKLANNAVTTAKVADSAITTAKIADSAVTSSKLADISTAKVDGAELTKALSHRSTKILLGNQDWTSLIYSGASNCTYDATNRGVKITGNTFAKIRTRVPVHPDRLYRVKAKVRKLSGDGTFYIGAISMDQNYNELSTDQARTYNYFGALNVTITAGNTYYAEGVISGYNAPTDNNHNRFDPEAKYFDLVIIANYNATQNPSETVIEWLELEEIYPYETNTTSGRNGLLIGNPSDLGVHHFGGISIAVPSTTTKWPLGIIKGGDPLLRVDHNGNAYLKESLTVSRINGSNAQNLIISGQNRGVSIRIDEDNSGGDYFSVNTNRGPVLVVNSGTDRVGISVLNPSEKLEVYGNVRAERFIANAPTGTAPFSVTSRTKVDNLNADLLDGYDSVDFPRKQEDATITGTWTFNRATTMWSINNMSPHNFLINGRNHGVELRINETGSSGDFRVTSGANGATTLFRVAGSGHLSLPTNPRVTFGDKRIINVYVDHGGDTNTRYYYLGKVNIGSGILKIQGIMGGHTWAEGRANVDLQFSARDGFRVDGKVIGRIGQADIWVYSGGDNFMHLYLVTKTRALVNLELSSVGAANVEFDGSFTYSAPTHGNSNTPFWKLSTDTMYVLRYSHRGALVNIPVSYSTNLSTNGSFSFTAKAIPMGSLALIIIYPSLAPINSGFSGEGLITLKMSLTNLRNALEIDSSIIPDIFSVQLTVHATSNSVYHDNAYNYYAAYYNSSTDEWGIQIYRSRFTGADTHNLVHALILAYFSWH